MQHSPNWGGRRQGAGRPRKRAWDKELSPLQKLTSDGDLSAFLAEADEKRILVLVGDSLATDVLLGLDEACALADFIKGLSSRQLEEDKNHC